MIADSTTTSRTPAITGRTWEEAERGVPGLRCSDPFIEAAWNHRWPKHPLEKQELVLTVPASFDEGARTLTLQAARLAGLTEVRLLEEPQAACYDWLQRHRDELDSKLQETRLVLVCDVGGGTTDLTLIQVEQTAQGPQLTRIGVGDHLMLGGDNMDLALVSGIDTERVIILTWGIGGALAAAGGILYAIDVQIHPYMGWNFLIPLFAATILGTVGNIYGALVGGLVIGVAQQVSTAFLMPTYKPAVAFMLMILILLVRPKGIFGGKD